MVNHELAEDWKDVVSRSDLNNKTVGVWFETFWVAGPEHWKLAQDCILQFNGIHRL